MSSPIDQQRRIQNLGISAPNQVQGGSIVTRDQLIAQRQQAARVQQQQDQQAAQNKEDVQPARRSRSGSGSTPSWARNQESQEAKQAKNDAEDQAIFAGFKAAKAEGAKHGIDVSSATVNIQGNDVTVKNVRGTPSKASQQANDRQRNNAIIDQEIANLKATGADLNGATIRVSDTQTGGKQVSVKGVNYPQQSTQMQYVNPDYNLKFGSERIGDIIQKESAKGDKSLFYGSRQVYDKKAVDAFVSDYSSYMNQKSYYDNVNKGLPAIDSSPDYATKQAVGFAGNKIISPKAENIDPFGNVRQAPRFTFEFEKTTVPKDLVQDSPARTGGMFGDLIDFGKGAGAQATNYSRDFVNMFGGSSAKAVFNVKTGKEYAPTPETDIITLGTKDLFNFRGQGGKVGVPDNGVKDADYAKIAQNYAKNPAYNTGALAVTAAAFLPKKAYEGITFLGKGLGLIADTSRTDKLALEASAHMRNLKRLDAGYSTDRARFGRATIDPIHDTSSVGGIGRIVKSDPISAILGGSIKNPTAFNKLYLENNFGIKPDLSENVSLRSNVRAGTIRNVNKNDIFTVGGRRSTNSFTIKPDLFEGQNIKSYVGVSDGGYIRPQLESDILVRRSTGKGSGGGGFKFDSSFGGGKPSGIKSVGDTFKEIKTSNGLILLVKQESQQTSLKADTLSLLAPQKTKKNLVRINPSLSEKVDLGFGSGQDTIKISKRKQTVRQQFGAGSYGFGTQGQDQTSRQIQRMLQGTAQKTKRKGKFKQSQQFEQLQGFDLAQIGKQKTKQAQKSATVQGLLPKSMLASLQGLQFKLATKQTTKQAQAQGQQYKFKQASAYKFQTDQAFKFDFNFEKTLKIPDKVPNKTKTDRAPKYPKLPPLYAGGYRKISVGRRKRGMKDYMQEFNVKDLVSVAAGENSPFAKAFNKQFKDWF